ncbi:MAG: glycosyltransferase [Chlorobium sp.]|nr:MAG: glycosyltransferase [Chlorobium sp.]
MSTPAVSSRNERPRVHGKFIYVGDSQFWIKGVTYGTFRPDKNGMQFPEAEKVRQDFALMEACGFNAVRVYTVPPRWLLDIALQHNLRVMAGIPWEQHITFLDDPKRISDIKQRVKAAVESIERHPAILFYAIGNEIPSSIVRWHGREKVEKFLFELYSIVKTVDPDGLVTYVNFPTTEYLQLPFLDLICFNVYLESEEKLSAYLARLQNIADDLPLVMAEIGLDSMRNGEEKQADVLDWQVRTAFAAGCSGSFIFAWTDEWYRGGHDIEDWDFGVTTRERKPKKALKSLQAAFSGIPFPKAMQWPKISVIVCSFNGSRTIRDTLEALRKVQYPDFEVIVVNDGSTDKTPDIAKEYNVRLITTENRGLSNARNTGCNAAESQLIVYTDDDAYPDPNWLTYLAHAFMTSDYVCIGGPNLPPLDDGFVAECIAHAPGGPVHVLLSDTEAEHVPGCNMAFRKSALLAIGGFDPKYRVAGDDVDVCWRLMEKGWKIGFNPAAIVWHHRRNSAKTYWRHQKGYGKAEALLEEKWPEKYNAAGYMSWPGRLYGKGHTVPLLSQKWRVYQGTWGSAYFQSIYEPALGTLTSLSLMPEWFVIMGFLSLLSIAGVFWAPLLLALPLLAVALGISIVQSIRSTRKAFLRKKPFIDPERHKKFLLTASFHFIQPLARLVGRLQHGLTPWRYHTFAGYKIPKGRTIKIWSEHWNDSSIWLEKLEQLLKKDHVPCSRGNDYDEWDFEVRGGLLGSVKLLMAVEEHGAGKQYLRFRLTPSFSKIALGFTLFFAVLACLALSAQAWIASLFMGCIALIVLLRTLLDGAIASAFVLKSLENLKSLANHA